MNSLPLRPVSLRVVAAVLLVLGAATSVSQSQEPTKSPLVLAVENARPSVVAIRLAKSTSKKDTVGTGVIIHADGLVITNRHVVGSYKSLHVRLHDGYDYLAQVLVADANADLALLRIQSPGVSFQAMSVHALEHLWVGEEVIAIGHPYGYTFTVSRGIVSAVGREITMPTGEVLSGLIQTDASINPGNSGGPLLNAQGQLIGINVALREGAQGIAFAINADTVRSFVAKHLGGQWLAQQPAKAPATKVTATPAPPMKNVAPADAAKSSAKSAPTDQLTGQAKEAPKAKAVMAEEKAPAAAPVAHEESVLESTTQSETKSAPAPTSAAGWSSGPGPATTTSFAAAGMTPIPLGEPLLLVVISLLLLILGQQYLLLRRSRG